MLGPDRRFGSKSPEKTETLGVGQIFPACNPLQIFLAIISLNAVLVIHLGFAFWIINPCEGHQSVHKPATLI